MDITTLAAWGEFLGGIAVVVSLIYLAGQIRMSTKTAREGWARHQCNDGSFSRNAFDHDLITINGIDLQDSRAPGIGHHQLPDDELCVGHDWQEDRKTYE